MTDNSDNRLVLPGDVPAAIGLLTRLPVTIDAPRGAAAAWAYPLAGLVLALVAGLAGQVGLWCGVGPGLAAGLALAALVIASGGLHEDGLADSADGLWGGRDMARRLEIMRDSRIGSYGVIALVLALGLRWLALATLAADGALWPALLIAAAASRAAMLAPMAALPHARADGLAHAVGRPGRDTALLAAGIAVATTLLFWPSAVVLLALACAGTAAGCTAIARAKIGGQTGDILGATQQITEIAALLALVALL